MVVAQIEGALFRQGHPNGIAFAQNILQLADLLIPVNPRACFQLAQMLLAEVVQYGEDHRRGSCSRVEVLVLDGGIDAGVRCRIPQALFVLFEIFVFV